MWKALQCTIEDTPALQAWCQAVQQVVMATEERFLGNTYADEQATPLAAAPGVSGQQPIPDPMDVCGDATRGWIQGDGVVHTCVATLPHS